ncbi:MAG TPA: DUF4239 domain-containing protein [Methylomirabilota bacterium]|nr:DUF4239 domain-containing protein [Methylomirabilota bacterium]
MNFIEGESALFALGLFAGIMLMIELGWRVGARQRARVTEGGGAGVGSVEAATFGLLGLLVAFTFQGASARFDARRELIVQEANDIGTAWLRIDLLPASQQPAMRELFRKYLDSRLETYRKIPDMVAVKAELDRTAQLQNEIWKIAMLGQKEAGQAVVAGLLPVLNQMFDIVTTRTMAAKAHPPRIVFFMLAFMACAAAFMAGHGMSGSKVRSWVHTLGFAFILTITVYVIMDMEYPRLGFIRVDSFDQVLMDLRQSMK